MSEYVTVANVNSSCKRFLSNVFCRSTRLDSLLVENGDATESLEGRRCTKDPCRKKYISSTFKLQRNRRSSPVSKKDFFSFLFTNVVYTMHVIRRAMSEKEKYFSSDSSKLEQQLLQVNRIVNRKLFKQVNRRQLYFE